MEDEMAEPADVMAAPPIAGDTVPTEVAPAPAPASAPAAPPSGSGDDDAPTVPTWRLREARSERDSWKARFEEGSSKIAQAEKVLGEVDTLRSRLAELEAARAEDRALWASGFHEEEAQDTARWQWSRVPADKRPEGGFSAWLSDLRSNPDKAHASLRPFLGGSTPKPTPTPNVNGGVQPGAEARVTGDVVTPERIAAAREKALKTGVWDEVEALRKLAMSQR